MLDPILDPFRAEIELQSLRYSCGHKMFCPITGRCLDVRRAVEFSLWDWNEQEKCRGVFCVDATKAETPRAALAQAIVAMRRFRSSPWPTITMIDGRAYTSHGQPRQRYKTRGHKRAVDDLRLAVDAHNRRADAHNRYLRAQLQLPFAA